MVVDNVQIIRDSIEMAAGPLRDRLLSETNARRKLETRLEKIERELECVSKRLHDSQTHALHLIGLIERLSTTSEVRELMQAARRGKDSKMDDITIS